MRNVDIKAYNAEAASFGQKVTTGKTTYLCCYAASCTALGIYAIVPGVDGNGVGGPVLSAVANVDNTRLGVPQATLASAGYVWVAVEGVTNATVTKSSSIDAAGKYLEVVAAAVKLTYDGGTFGIQTAAISLAAHTGSGDGTLSVYLVGELRTPAAA